MTKKSTKRALLLSVLSIVVCISMLVGSTFAWFTDKATTGVNKIVSGNLDVALYYGTVADGEITYSKVVENETLLFDPNALWEPGYTEVAYLKIANEGNLGLKALFTVNFSKQVAGTSVEGNEIKLSNYLMYDLIPITEGEFYADRDDARDAAVTNAKNIATEQNEVTLPAGSPDLYYALVVYMPEEVGNEANYRGDAIPSINLGVTLIATQLTAESDSFDDQYDDQAQYPSSIQNNEGLYEALESSDNVTIKNGNYELPINVPNGKTVNVEGGDFSATEDTNGSAFNIGENGNLTISSSDIVATKYNVAVKASDGANLNINKGTYAATDIQVISASSDVDVVITGGEYSGTVAVWMDDSCTVDISGGTFNTYAIVYAEQAYNCSLTISGGTFNVSVVDLCFGIPTTITGGTFKVDPSDYVDTSAYTVTEADGWYTVTPIA